MSDDDIPRADLEALAREHWKGATYNNMPETRLLGWEDLEAVDKMRLKRVWRLKHPDIANFDPSIGITESQLERLCKIIDKCLDEALPQLVPSHVQIALSNVQISDTDADKILDEFKTAQRFLNCANTINSETRRMLEQTTTYFDAARDEAAALRETVTKQADTIASLERRAARHAEHLAGLETKIAKIRNG
jgi:hypothetical protein